MSETYHFEIQIDNVLICGHVDYNYSRNEFSGNDPRAEDNLDVDFKTMAFDAALWEDIDYKGDIAKVFCAGFVKGYGRVKFDSLVYSKISEYVRS